MSDHPVRRRSVLYVPASNGRAMDKLAILDCDAAILDLEDAIAPEQKVSARETVEARFSALRRSGRELVIRINPAGSPWFADDLALARALEPDGILLPKVDTPRDVLEAGDALDEADAPESVRLWAMIETPKALLNIGAIAELGRDPASRLSCLVVGSNDIVKETGVRMTPDRRHLVPWLMQVVLAARAGGLDVLDGVRNDFSDLEAFARECDQGAAMGFDGKTLIHPAQIAPANAAFSPAGEEVEEAHGIVAAFALPENAGKGVISLGGRMVERLHLAQARRVLARAGAGESS